MCVYSSSNISGRLCLLTVSSDLSGMAFISSAVCVPLNFTVGGSIVCGLKENLAVRIRLMIEACLLRITLPPKLLAIILFVGRFR